MNIGTSNAVLLTLSCSNNFDYVLLLAGSLSLLLTGTNHLSDGLTD